MTRPQIIRADSIDLQDHDAPSAQDHKHSQTDQTSPLGTHQAETLREVAAGTKEQRRTSWVHGDIGDIRQYGDDPAVAAGAGARASASNMHQQDALANGQNGGASPSASDDGDMDASQDGDLDDDMMDRISSSPSIEDGWSTPASKLPSVWPVRVDSLRMRPSNLTYGSTSSLGFSEPASSSPSMERLAHAPMKPSKVQSLEASNAGHTHDPPSSESTAPDATNHWGHGAQRKLDVLPRETAENTGRDSGLGLTNDGLAPGDSPSTASAVSHGSHSEGEEEEREDEWEDVDDELSESISPYDFLIPYTLSEGGEEDDLSYVDGPELVDSGWDGECLQDAEDIDFDFVYALHTFVATVEGQANAMKGDTMVLLDDSNSYWWLVRVVKDSSIGYLPAEHIETPTERLARLNKHRNIDLSATMLGDQEAKSKNPIKTAMRRRKTKNVTFAAPTYVDYSEIEYSSDEEDAEAEFLAQQAAQQQRIQQQAAAKRSTDEEDDEDEMSAEVEPLKPRSVQKQAHKDPTKASDDVGAHDGAERHSDESDNRSEGSLRTTRHGTVRNTDSFFRDDSVETKKITLTPNLLRDDNDGRASSESKEARQQVSIDKLEKELVPDIKSKDDKKRKDKEKKEKEKKPSAIRSFFSRKDKKKSAEDDDESFGKRSMDIASENVADDDAQPAESESPGERGEKSTDKATAAQRSAGKLLKLQPREEVSLAPKSASSPPTPVEVSTIVAVEGTPNNVSNVPPTSMRVVGPDGPDRLSPPREGNSQSTTSKMPHKSLAEEKPQQVSKAKSRVELDDFDSSEAEDQERERRPEPDQNLAQEHGEATGAKGIVPDPEKRLRPSLPGAYPDSFAGTPATTAGLAGGAERVAKMERLSESPVQVSPVTSSNPPALVGDNSSLDDVPSPLSSSSPEPVEVRNRGHHNQDSMTSTSAASTSHSTWNDTSLRAFFDSSSDVHDLLAVVYDKSDLPSPGPDHPVASTLFREQNAKLAEITTQLDNMLGDWLARKQRLRGAG